MDISQRGLALLYEFEGKHKKLPDGRYKAYRCPANVPTIYCGLTHGVKDGMIVTEAEGEAMLRKELVRYEDAVERLVTVEMSQARFDSLTLFVFNVGIGAFEKSTLLRLLNQGKDEAAALQFHRWVNGGGKKLPGLVRRRAAEAALFMETDKAPVEMATDEPSMPQKVDEAKPSVTSVAKESVTVKLAAGGILSAIGKATMDAYDWLFSVAKEAGPEVLALKTSIGPLDPLIKATPAILTVLVVAALGGVIIRKIQTR